MCVWKPYFLVISAFDLNFSLGSAAAPPGQKSRYFTATLFGTNLREYYDTTPLIICDENLPRVQIKKDGHVHAYKPNDRILKFTTLPFINQESLPVA